MFTFSVCHRSFLFSEVSALNSLSAPISSVVPVTIQSANGDIAWRISRRFEEENEAPRGTLQLTS